MDDSDVKELRWIGNSQDDLREFPDEVRSNFWLCSV